MCIGLKIKGLMSKEKMDAPTLARRLGKTKQAVYDMLEKEDVNTAILRQLSGIFKVPVTFFLTEEQENGNQEELDLLRREIVTLKEEIQRLKDLKLPNRNDRRLSSSLTYSVSRIPGGIWSIKQKMQPLRQVRSRSIR